MRGADITQEELFSYRTLEERIPDGHPIRKLRKLRKVVDLLLKSMDEEFEPLYARTGRESIPATQAGSDRSPGSGGALGQFSGRFVCSQSCVALCVASQADPTR